MPLWIPLTSAEQPEVTLTNWRVFEVLVPEIGRPTFHFVGYCGPEHAGRVSSPVEEFDPVNRCGVSSTGRVYCLAGTPGLNGDAEYLWLKWLRIWGASVLRDCSQEALVEFAEAKTKQIQEDGGANAANSAS